MDGPSRRTPRPDSPRRGPLTCAQRDVIRAAVAALPPLTDEQIDALCEVINSYRARHGRATHTTGFHETDR
jgi:hypothetical protein